MFTLLLVHCFLQQYQLFIELEFPLEAETFAPVIYIFILNISLRLKRLVRERFFWKCVEVEECLLVCVIALLYLLTRNLQHQSFQYLRR
jgi:hypothetical protein